MQVISGAFDFCLEQRSAVAIGKFDGVHLGHQKLLAQILNQKKNGLPACVFTFDKAPAVLFGGADGRELLTVSEKRAKLEKLGVDVLIEFPLTYESAAIPPQEFVREVLVKRLKLAYIAAGEDLSFGAGGRGDAALLERMAEEGDFVVQIVDKVRRDTQEISSTYVRELLEQGNMELVAELLGEPYRIKGTVVHGRQLGRYLDMPTVNILPPAGKLLPPFGVYCSAVYWKDRRYNAVTNLGCKPTVSREQVVGAESYLYDFDEELYGEEIVVELCSYVRAEQRFAGPEELKKQLALDKMTVADWHQSMVKFGNSYKKYKKI